jgi:hypothetical protein
LAVFIDTFYKVFVFYLFSTKCEIGNMKQKTFKSLLSGFNSQHLFSSLFLRNVYNTCSLASIVIPYPCSFTLMSTARAKHNNVPNRKRVSLLLLPIFLIFSLLLSLKTIS